MIVYITENLINGKKYIGRDQNNNKSYLGSGVSLKKAFKKYGKENFKKEILEYCDDNEHLKEREIYWLEFFDAQNNPKYYNRTNKTSGYKSGLRTCSKSTKKKMSTWRKGIKDSEHTKQLKSLAKIGKPSGKLGYKYTEEQRSKMRGPKSIEHRIKMSKPRSLETKRKMSLAKVGKPSNYPYKPILQYDLEGNFIKEWESVKQAKDAFKGDIDACLSGKQRKAANFKWNYK